MSADPATGSSSGTPQDLVGKARLLIASVLAHLRVRLELLSVELAIEKVRLLTVMLTGLLAVIFGAMSLMLIVLFVLAVYWDTPDRVTAVGWMLGIFIVLTAVAAVWLGSQLSRPSALFSSSLAELDKDVAAVERA